MRDRWNPRSGRRRPSQISSYWVGLSARARGVTGPDSGFRSDWSARIRGGSAVAIGAGVEILRHSTVEVFGGGAVSIGDRVRIKQAVWIADYGGRVRIGDDVLIGTGSIVFGHGGVDIGHRTMLSPYVTVISSEHAFWREGPLGQRGFTREPVSIGTDVWIGTGAVVTAGSVVEDDVVVGACSVVSGKLETGYLYAGSPARRISPLRGIPGQEHRDVDRWPQ